MYTENRYWQYRKSPADTYTMRQLCCDQNSYSWKPNSVSKLKQKSGVIELCSTCSRGDNCPTNTSLSLFFVLWFYDFEFLQWIFTFHLFWLQVDVVMRFRETEKLIRHLMTEQIPSLKVDHVINIQPTSERYFDKSWLFTVVATPLSKLHAPLMCFKISWYSQ